MDKYNFKEIQELIANSESILIVSHASPDPDAVASTLFTHKMLEHNFPDKRIYSNIESAKFDGYKSLFDASFITTHKFDYVFGKVKPDLLIVLDLSNLDLISRERSETTIPLVESVKTILIDHHNDEINGKIDFSINEQDSSCIETVYNALVKGVRFITYPKYFDHVLFGIVGDTGGFRYLKKHGVETLKVVAELIKEGGNVDRVTTVLGRLNMNELAIHGELFNNLVVNGDFTYTYISDRFFKDNPTFTDAEYSAANKIFVQNYLKSIEDAFWGFTFKPLKSGGYTISFRSEFGVMDLRVFAKHFNGGGHESSAGGFIEASSDKEALESILKVIDDHREEAFAGKLG